MSKKAFTNPATEKCSTSDSMPLSLESNVIQCHQMSEENERTPACARNRTKKVIRATGPR